MVTMKLNQLCESNQVLTRDEMLDKLHQLVGVDNPNINTIINQFAKNFGQKEIYSDDIGRSGVYYGLQIFESADGKKWYFIYGSHEHDEYNYGPVDDNVWEELQEPDVLDYFIDYL